MNFELLDAWFGYQLSHMFERYTGRRDRLAALDIMQVRRMPRIVNVVPEIPEEDPVPVLNIEGLGTEPAIAEVHVVACPIQLVVY
jgi:hypothetical protein